MYKPPRLLLHICCATCGAWLSDELSLKYEVDLFYFNPNIHPEKEYYRRLEEIKKVASILNLKVIDFPFAPKPWFKAVKGYENEPENGTRCPICFRHRLEGTAKYAQKHNYDAFATTLTTSKQKKAEIINPIGEDLARKYKVEFLSEDFKKNGGSDKSLACSNDYGVIRQNYCGCVFSLRDSYRQRIQKNS